VIFESLGLRPVINADARLTRLGGSLMPEPVLAAMREAAGSYMDMFELQQRVGRRLADLTRNEAAYVATGAEVRRRLWEGNPAIAVAPAGPRGISLTPDTLDAPGQAEIVAARLLDVIRAAQTALAR